MANRRSSGYQSLDGSRRTEGMDDLTEFDQQQLLTRVHVYLDILKEDIVNCHKEGVKAERDYTFARADLEKLKKQPNTAQQTLDESQEYVNKCLAKLTQAKTKGGQAARELTYLNAKILAESYEELNQQFPVTNPNKTPVKPLIPEDDPISPPRGLQTEQQRLQEEREELEKRQAQTDLELNRRLHRVFQEEERVRALAEQLAEQEAQHHIHHDPQHLVIDNLDPLPLLPVDEEQADELDDDDMANPVQGSQLNSLPIYNGETDVENWLMVVDRAQTQFVWTEGQTAAAVKSKLSGVAQKWLRSQEARRNPGLELWQQVPGAAQKNLRKLLKTRFSIVVSELAATEAISDLKQRPHETVDDFFDRVVLALDKKNHLYTEAQKRTDDYQRNLSSEIFTFFGAGLRETYRTQILGSHNPPTQPDDLLQAARAVELEAGRRKRLVDAVDLDEPLQPSPSPTQNNDSTLAKEVEALTRQFKNFTTAQKFSPGMANVTCFFCEGKGHYANKCPSKNQPSSSGSYPRGRGRGRFRGARGTRRGFRGRPRTSNEIWSFSGN